MKLYKHLQLQPDQRTALAERWHSWCRRRRHLDGAMNSAVAKLQNLLERSRNIPLTVLELATLASRIPAPTDTAAYIFHEPEVDGNVHETHALRGTSPRRNVHDMVAQSNRGECDSPQPTESVACNETSFRFAVSIMSATKSIMKAKRVDSCGYSGAGAYWNQANVADEQTSTLRSAAMLAAPSDDRDPSPMSAMSCDACSSGCGGLLGLEEYGWGAWQSCAREPCTECEGVNCVEVRLLGESGEMIQAAHEALKSITAVSESGGLMHCEFLAPFWELTEVCPQTSYSDLSVIRVQLFLSFGNLEFSLAACTVEEGQDHVLAQQAACLASSTFRRIALHTCGFRNCLDTLSLDLERLVRMLSYT